jgi:hypothetical protein
VRKTRGALFIGLRCQLVGLKANMVITGDFRVGRDSFGFAPIK